MRQTIFILYSDHNKNMADRIGKSTFVNQRFYSKDMCLTNTILLDMASTCNTEYFYVIRAEADMIFPDFNFDIKPDIWDSEYMHIWNNDTAVCLYNKTQVQSYPSRYTDDALSSGQVKLKNIQRRIYSHPVLDIVFLSYDEIFADKHYANLVARFPRSKRVHGVKGIYQAHKAAADLVSSDKFFVVDADAIILPDFDFSYYPSAYDIDSVHVWHSRNPINDLEYGYGGVKLFPTEMLRAYSGNPVDFTTSVSKSFKVVPAVSNITAFNVDPFSTWRSAFRECTKLAVQDNDEANARLEIWCSVGGDRDFGDFALMGANEGMKFGIENKDQPEELRLINDFSWLEEKFSS